VTEFLGLATALVLSALFSGSETGFYSLSPARLGLDAREGRRFGRLVKWLVSDEHALLVAVLIGNVLTIQLATEFGGEFLARLGLLPAVGREFVLTALLTPVVFLLAELLPKDLFRRRPHRFLGLAAPVLAVARVLFLPLALPLRALARLLERSLGIGDAKLADLENREHVHELLEEGTLSGALPKDAVDLARNVLELRSRRVAEVMVPWRQVTTVGADLSEADFLRRVATSGHTRVPVVGARGEVQGYVHQLDVLGDARPGRAARALRPLLEVEPHLSVDRALARLRARGQRAALVREAGRPVGLVTLKDLAQTIVGELADW